MGRYKEEKDSEMNLEGKKIELTLHRQNRHLIEVISEDLKKSYIDPKILK